LQHEINKLQIILEETKLKNKINVLKNQIITAQATNINIANNANNANNINNVNTYNGTVINNTINIVPFGTEKIDEMLSLSEKIKILERKMLSIDESIKTVHFNDNRPEYKNIFISNLKNDIAYIHNGTKFIASSKREILDCLTDFHLANIESLIDENNNNNIRKYVSPQIIGTIEKLLNKMEDDEEPAYDMSGKKFKNHRTFKINGLKQTIYNESKISDVVKKT
jgi:hypothetical protein